MIPIRVMAISTEIAEAVRRDGKRPALRPSGAHGNCRRRRAVPALFADHCCWRGEGHAVYFGRVCRHRDAAAARPGLHPCGWLRALSRRWRVSSDAAEQPADAERIRARTSSGGDGICGERKRGCGSRETLCAGGCGLHPRAQHDGGLLYVSDRACRPAHTSKVSTIS